MSKLPRARLLILLTLGACSASAPDAAGTPGSGGKTGTDATDPSWVRLEAGADATACVAAPDECRVLLVSAMLSVHGYPKLDGGEDLFPSPGGEDRIVAIPLPDVEDPLALALLFQPDHTEGSVGDETGVRHYLMSTDWGRVAASTHNDHDATLAEILRVAPKVTVGAGSEEQAKATYRCDSFHTADQDQPDFLLEMSSEDFTGYFRSVECYQEGSGLGPRVDFHYELGYDPDSVSTDGLAGAL